MRASARNQFIKLCKKEEICVCAWHGKSRSENARMIYLAALHVLLKRGRDLCIERGIILIRI